MKNCNIKQKCSNEKGITLVALMVTVFVMLIIAGASVNNGIESLNSTRLEGFYMQLETVQKRADDIAVTNEKYTISNEDGTKTYIDLKTTGGSDLTSSQTTFLQSILDKKRINISADEFRYFTITDLDKQLDLTQMDYNVFIHFDTRTVVAENGIDINGETYYMLENNIYYVEQDTSKNVGTLELTYSITKYGASNYKIIVTPNKIGDLTTNGTLRYKEKVSKYWETANGLEIIISNLTQYSIEYVDSNQNVASEIITVELDNNGNPTITISQ